MRLFTLSLLVLTACGSSKSEVDPPITTAPTNPTTDSTVTETCEEHTYYADSDGDTFGDPSTSTVACTPPDDYVLNSLDCDDSSADRFPGNFDLPADGVDQDCDGAEMDNCYEDLDGDGYGNTVPQPNAVPAGGDGSSCADPANLLSATGDDCDDLLPEIHPEQFDIPADGIDQDCDDMDSCYVDSDVDGHGDSIGTIAQNVVGVSHSCFFAAGYSGVADDCADADPTSYPKAREIACDGVSQDCTEPDSEALAAIVSDELSPFAASDFTAIGTPSEQLTSVLAAALPGDVVRLCAEETYVGNFIIDVPLVLQGGGATFSGAYPPPADPAACFGSGDSPVLRVDSNGSTVLQELRVQGGCTDGMVSQFGGGLVISGSSEVSAEELTIAGNAASMGGGLAVLDEASLVWLSGELSSNAALSGGGAWVGPSAHLSMGGGGSFEVKNNEATLGGAVYSTGTFDFSDSTLSNNSALEDGGAVYSTGTVDFSNVGLFSNSAARGNTIFLTTDSSLFTYTIAYGENGDVAPNIFCDYDDSQYSTLELYSSCDTYGCLY